MFLRVLLLCIITVVGYFLGNLNGALIASRYVFHKDIRKYGSGNAGLTNYTRVFGKKGVGLLLGIDIGKTVVAVLIGWGLMAIGFLPDSVPCWAMPFRCSTASGAASVPWLVWW